MTKIKNFRISLRSREIARLLKNCHGISMTPDLEASVEQAIQESKRFLQTAAVFTTLSKAAAEKVAPLPMTNQTTAISFIAATIGSQLEAERAGALARQDESRARLLEAVQEEALHQTLQFAMKLIQDQAKEEECELSALSQAETASLLPPLAALLGIQRIGLEFDVNAPGLPPYARLTWTLWMPVTKSSSRRSDTSAQRVTAAV